MYESTAPRGGGVTVAALLIALVTVTGLFTRPLLAIDETRYAAVALEMLQRGNWLVPHLNAEAYSHKPPLLFWMVVGGWKLFGVRELWARLVGPLAGVVALGLVSALARALWPDDARARGWAPLITGGALIWATFGTLFMFDTLLACAALLGMLGVHQAVEHDRRRGVFFLAAAITLGVLAKGPVILIHLLPVSLAAPWWATVRVGRRWGHWYAALVSGKQLHYLLPLMPACALLLARGLSQRAAAPLSRPWVGGAGRRAAQRCRHRCRGIRLRWSARTTGSITLPGDSAACTSMSSAPPPCRNGWPRMPTACCCATIADDGQ